MSPMSLSLDFNDLSLSQSMCQELAVVLTERRAAAAADRESAAIQAAAQGAVQGAAQAHGAVHGSNVTTC